MKIESTRTARPHRPDSWRLVGLEQLFKTVMHSISVRLATPADQDAIEAGIRDWYLPYEPMSTGHEIKTAADYELSVLYNIAKEGMTLIAVNEAGELAGLLTNTTACFDKRGKKPATHSCPRYQAMTELVCQLEQQVDLFADYGIGKSFHMDTMAVKPEMRGQSIGYRLFVAAFELAHKLDYELVTVHCSSQFTAQLAEKCQMKCVASVRFEDFKGSTGVQPFHITSPLHTHLRKYLKLIEN